ncbi:MAG: D-alanine--D-alanine ligase [Clostridiales bacterium]|jgi:D-alanine-D-alanine ligase|nr:D-alanine--D-alanine ligase [Clostridiales bacterium]
MKLNLLVFFGGKSCEHDISIITAHQAMDFIDESKYNIYPIYIDINGLFLHGKELKNFEFCKNIDYHKLQKVYLKPADRNIYYKNNKILCKADVALLCMHGLNGEDGTLQGMLEMSDIPYTSSSVLGSALGMDKIAMKMFFKGLGLNVLPYAWTYKEEYYHITGNQDFLDRAQALGYPLIVKPSNLGSSIGITRVSDIQSLKAAMDIAFKFDHRVLVERALTDFIEVNCSVLGCPNEYKVSVCERPLSWQAFLTFEEKYLSKGVKMGGMDSLKRKLPADIPEEMSSTIQNQSKQVFLALGCKGVIRIDYIIDKTDNTVYINEVNTIPGSLSYYLWDYSGTDFFELIDKLIQTALYAADQKRYLKYAYVSNVLNCAGGGKT